MRKQAPMPDSKHGGHHAAGRFFSLRRKLVVILLALSLSMSALFAVFFQRYLLERYEDSRSDAFARYTHQINGLIRQQRLHLEQVAMTLPVLSQVRSSLAKGDLKQFQSRFDEFWSAFQLDMDLDVAHYFNAQGAELARWGGETPYYQSVSADIWQKTLQQAIARESPTSFISCKAVCRIYALTPVLAQGDVVGLFMVGASLAETVLAFHNTAGVDIAIFSALTDAHDLDAPVKEWGMQMHAASNAKATKALIDELAAQTGLDRLTRSAQQFKLSDKVYEAGHVVLDADNRAPDMYLLVLEDISSGLANVQETARRFLMLNISAVAIYLFLLSFMLDKPLKRLLRTVSAMPLLGRGAFAELRNTIRPRKRIRFHDEVDVLDRAAFALSYRLESLEHDVGERTRSLQAALHEVSREKAFAASLLDHAQAIIVTSDSLGRILSLNRYGRVLGGYTENDVISRPLAGSPLIPGEAVNPSDRLARFITAQQSHYRHEAALQCHDGSLRMISWIHTHLDDEHENAAVLLSVGVDITERKQNEARLLYLADHDPLTGCYNRRRFHEELERLLDETQRYSSKGALLYLDLDHFKYLNDTCGHQAGDNLLLLVVDELRKLMRSSDIIARLGGDEFAIAMLDADGSEAISAAERINQQLEIVVYPGLGINHRISASIGIALFPRDGTDAKELLVNADIAMYQAKEQGRFGWHLFSTEEKARERMHEWVIWDEHIKRGICENNFELYFQPVLSFADNAVRHYEVLLRLRLDDGTLAAPGRFLDIAERSGLIHDLDRWVVRKALERLAALPEAQQHLCFAINLSGSSIGNPKLLDEIQESLSALNVDPRRIIFEITETAAVADLSKARKFINVVREFGCSFALDDFGSGFASFFYLKQFPVDYVKIDGLFIRNLMDNSDDQILVRAMVEIARAYHKKTVAEFIDTEAVFHLLREYGVDYAQGYFIGKPAPHLSPWVMDQYPQCCEAIGAGPPPT
jgi:diguanylate cyclase (GGDEF)-like protein/PAS domain S-box-containing protein